MTDHDAEMDAILELLEGAGLCGRRLRGETLLRAGRKPIRYYRCPGRRE